MKRKILITAFGLFLLLCLNVNAQKDMGNTEALSTFCESCSYTVMNDDSYYLGESNHAFKFDSDGKSVNRIEVTFKVHTTGDVSYGVNPVFTGYGVMDTVSYATDSATWINVQLADVDGTVFADETVFDLVLSTTACNGIGEEVLIEITDYPDKSYYSFFFVDGEPNNAYTPVKNDGYRIMYDPEITVSLIGIEDDPVLPETCEGQYPGDANSDGSINISDQVYLINFLYHNGPPPDPIQNGDCNGDCVVDEEDLDVYSTGEYVTCSCEEMTQQVDSNVVGAVVNVPVYLRNVNFDYKMGVFLVTYPDGLIYDSITTTDISEGFVGYDQDTAVYCYLNTDDTLFDPTLDYPEPFLNLHFTLDSNVAEPDNYYYLTIDDDYYFLGCPNYADTGYGDALTKVWVKAITDYTRCYTCESDIDNDHIDYEVDEFGFKESNHLYSFNSDGRQVEEVEVTLRVETTDDLEYEIIDRGYGQPDVSNLYNDGSSYWLNLSWLNIPDVAFNNSPLFELTLKTRECLSIDDSIFIEIIGNLEQEYYNRFKQTGTAYYQTLEFLGSASMFMNNPEVVMSVMGYEEPLVKEETCDYMVGDVNGDGSIDQSDYLSLISFLYNDGPAPDPFQIADADTNCFVDTNDIQFLINYLYMGGDAPAGCSCEDMPQIIDSNIVNEEVKVPVFFRDINLDYTGYSYVALFHDDALVYNTFDNTEYSINFQHYPLNENIDLFYYTGSDVYQHPEELPDTFLTVNYTIDSNKTYAGDYLEVYISDDTTQYLTMFTGCPDYIDTVYGDIATAWVVVSHDTMICYECIAGLSDDVIEYDLDASGMKKSNHSFTINSDGRQVEDIEVSLKVNSGEGVNFNIVDAGYGAPVINSYDDGSALWIDLKWYDVGDVVFNDAVLFDLELFTNECVPPSDSIAIEVINRPESNFFNSITETGKPYPQYLINFGTGYLIMEEPLAHVSLWESDDLPEPLETCEDQYPGDANGDGRIDISDIVYLINFFYHDGMPPNPFQNGDANGDCVVDTLDLNYLLDYYGQGDPPVDCSCAEMPQILDSNFAGEIVSVPVYFRDVNFDYRNGFDIEIKHDSRLVYNTLDLTDYSTGTILTDQTDSSFILHLESNSIDRPQNFPEILLTVKFNLPSDIYASGRMFPVSINGEYTFSGCPEYEDTGTDDIPVTYVQTIWDETIYCPFCDLDIANDSIYLEIDEDGMTESNHLITFNSDGHEVDEIDVTIKVNTTYDIKYEAVDQGYGVPDTSSYSDGSAWWMNFTWIGLSGQVIDDASLFTLKMSTLECVAPGDSLTVTFEELPSSGYYNLLKETGTEYEKNVVKLFEGYAITYEPVLSVSLLDDGQLPGQIVDSTYGSDQVRVPVYFKDLNFDYNQFLLYFKWDDGLDLDSIGHTDYCINGNYGISYHDTDSITIYVYPSSYKYQHPDIYPEEFLSLWFSVDTLAYDPGTDFKVEMYQEPYVQGCPDYFAYGDTLALADENVYVRYSDSNIVIGASYTMSDDSSGYDVIYTDFYNYFSFDSDSIEVDEIDVSFKIFSDNMGYVHVIDTIITNYEFFEFEKYNDGDGYRCHVNITGLDGTAFENEPLFKIHFSTTDCLVPHDSIEIRFESITDSGYYNQFKDVNGVVKTLLDRDMNSGYDWFIDPVVELTILPDGQDNGYIIDSTYFGNMITLPVYFKTVNFDYTDGFIFKLKFDSALDYHSLGQTYYSTDYRYESEVTEETDTSITIQLDPGENDDIWLNHPDDPYSILINVNFTFNPDLAAPDENYQVSIIDDYIFTACENMADTGNCGDEYGYLKTVKQTASLKFGTLSMYTSTSGGKLYIYMKNSAPVLTDAINDFCGLRFAFDPTTLSYSSFVGFADKYPYQGDTIYWEDETIDGDTVAFDENRVMRSTYIRAADDYVRIGYFTINAGATVGTDFADFVRLDESPWYINNNFVVFKYTEDTLRYVDSVVNDVIYYGDLSLEGGSISVITSGGDVGCPMLYSWNGANYVMEDFILTQSHGISDPVAADDYYPMELGTVDTDGFYKIQISEFENEITYLDQVELIAVDYPIASRVGISNEGQVYTYSQSYKPVSAVDENGNDLLPYICSEDDLWFETQNSGSMILTYTNPLKDAGNSGFALTLGDEGGTIKDKDGSNDLPVEDRGDINNIIAKIEDKNGKWHDLGMVPPRQYLSENCTFYFNSELAELDETFRVEISWDNNFKTNVQEILVDDDADYMVRNLNPSYANHNKFGKVSQKISLIDDDMVTIIPGEKIDIKFSVSETVPEDGYTRKYFLKSNGYFKSIDESDLLPNDFVLYNNYPNPFNPTTTVKFYVPVSSEISLNIYNVLGQEVKTLYDGAIESGMHELQWHADNNNGAKVASGVYFYRLQSGDFNESKKMILLK